MLCGDNNVERKQRQVADASAARPWPHDDQNILKPLCVTNSPTDLQLIQDHLYGYSTRIHPLRTPDVFRGLRSQ